MKNESNQREKAKMKCYRSGNDQFPHVKITNFQIENK